jgi:hypothetical protein
MDVKVGRSDEGWEISVTKVQMTEKGKQLFGVDELVRMSGGVNAPALCSADDWNRTYTRCIEILCAPIPHTLNSSATRQDVTFRACMSRII